jgi:hypothetical protein
MYRQWAGRDLNPQCLPCGTRFTVWRRTAISAAYPKKKGNIEVRVFHHNEVAHFFTASINNILSPLCKAKTPVGVDPTNTDFADQRVSRFATEPC